ncbi:MAG: Upper collar protein [Candidatus Moranbacteria bacterium GW2011_GWF2_35_39]|nr:MAG: Upper collar protein [Candidatus Moranbacteria bacterium GW2011_GWF2_35_39]
MSRASKIRKSEENQQNKVDWLRSQLMNIWQNKATSIFQWEGEGITPFVSQQIERRLYEDGSVVLFKDDDGVVKVYRWAMDGGLNGYGLPVSWRVFGMNGTSEQFSRSEKDSVLIWNDLNRMATASYIKFIIDYKLINIEDTIDTQLNAHKIPFVFTGNKSQLLTFENVFKKVSGGVPVIYMNEASPLNNAEFQLFPTNVTFVADQLKQLRHDYEDDMMDYLGLCYVGIEKKERLITSEAEGTEDSSNSSFASRYGQRKRACEEWNKIYPDMKLKVKLNEGLLMTEEEKAELKEKQNAGNRPKEKDIQEDE